MSRIYSSRIHIEKKNLSTAAGALCTVRSAVLKTNFKSSVQLIKISILEINPPFFFNLRQNLATSSLSKLFKSKGVIVKRLNKCLILALLP